MTLSDAYHVGHMNFGLLRGEWDSPVVAGFVEAVERVNALAERTPGFVVNIGGDELYDQLAVADDPIVSDPKAAVTLSVWKDAAALGHFVHNTLHGSFLRRRAEWFEPLDRVTYVVWPIAAGHRPTIAEGLARLKQLEQDGPTAAAFDLTWALANSSEAGNA